MKESILQLKDYFFTKTAVEVNKDFNFSKPSDLGVDDLLIDLESEILKHPNTGEQIFKVSLRVVAKPEDQPECNLPYSIDITAIGLFGLNESCQENRESIAVINGASILFSSIREYASVITSQGPFRKIVLPTVDLRGLKKLNKEQQAPISRPKTTKKKA